ncbi:NUDIX hydrolase [Streptacidiphilus monticola]|uniref:NUDIX domain-containing protein n=1 Tax=Streptacidiphilus monticola TaxID=2161674 RepID=A0ABW1FXF5_9ACTN
MAIPEFVRDLRAMIGDHPLWMSGVCAVVLDPDGERVLMNRRADTGRWALIGGIIDPGEQPAAAAVREVREETGVEIVVERLVSAIADPPVRFANGDRAQFLCLTFLCRAVGGTARVNDDESLEIAWFPLDQVPELPPHAARRLELALGTGTEAFFEAP